MWSEARFEPQFAACDTAVTAHAHERNRDIEVLRAVAVCGVILHHLTTTLLARQYEALNWIAQYLDYWSGVDLFFAISGYVIARSLLPALLMHTDRAGFWREAGAFWIRRVFRLLPSSWLWLSIILLASVFFNSLRVDNVPVFGTPLNNLRATLAGLGFYSNFFQLWASAHNVFNASFAWWTLSMEEQFYFILPFAAFCLRRYLWIALILFVCVSAYFSHFTPLTMCLRTEAITFGVLIALWEKHATWPVVNDLYRRIPTLLRASINFGLLFLLGFAATLGPFTPRVLYLAIVSALLVFIAAQNRGYLFPHGRTGKVALWIGSRSYALYLVHVPAFLGAKELCYRLTGSVFDSFVAPAGMIALLIFVELNWRFLETPLRRYGVRLAQNFRSRGELVRS